MSREQWLRSLTVLCLGAILVPCARTTSVGKVPAIVRQNCSGCHGLDGNSQLPYFPRVAGLNAAYAERKIQNFRATAKPEVDELFSRVMRMGRPVRDPGMTPQGVAYMVGVAHSISEADARRSAEWYAAQEAGAGRGSDPRLMKEGRDLFTNGLKSQGLIACQTCHGPDANGTAIAPRLAGQNAAYMEGQLALFRAGDRRHSPEMTAVAQNVEGEQARSVAAYLQSK